MELPWLFLLSILFLLPEFYLFFFIPQWMELSQAREWRGFPLGLDSKIIYKFFNLSEGIRRCGLYIKT